MLNKIYNWLQEQYYGNRKVPCTYCHSPIKIKNTVFRSIDLEKLKETNDFSTLRAYCLKCAELWNTQ